MLRIGTRQSRLALVQTNRIIKRIHEAFPEEEIVLVPIVTQGDKRRDKPLASFGGKGVFTKEIEEQLLDGSIDIAVHSAKDMPMEFPEGLSLGAVVEREDPRDVLVTRTGVCVGEMPGGSIIGTGSLRRELQIRRLNPRAEVQSIRGNVPTRLEKLRDGQYDAVLLAAAGLRRLGLEQEADLSYEYLEPGEFVPAAGQGILALEIRTGTFGLIMEALNHTETELCFKAERAFLQRIGGSCNAPCGVYCRGTERGIVLLGMYAGDGQHPSFDADTMQLPTGYPAEKQAVKEAKEAALQKAKQLADRLKRRRVSLVGAGPGSRELLSQRALACIKAADVIVYDNLISPSILNEARLEAELIYAGKRADAHSMKQEEMNRLLVEKALAGRYVVRLKGGDPFVFGRGGEEAQVLRAQGIPYDVVPGISSAYSVPAYAGIPVTHRGISSSVHIVTGHEDPQKPDSGVDYQALALEKGTLVFLMGLGRLGRIAERLIAAGKNPQTPTAVIQGGTTARQRAVCAPLAEMEAEVRKAGILTPAVIVIGAAAGLAEELDWQVQRPLSGRRILLTGTRQMNNRLEQELEPLGAETASLSLIETIPLVSGEADELLRKIEHYQWIAFTSSAGVQTFFSGLRRLGMDRRMLSHLHFCAVGASTGQTLEEYGYFCDFIPGSYDSKTLAREWIPTLAREDRVLLVQAREGSGVLLKGLQEAGIDTDRACLYETIADSRRRDELGRLINEADYTVLASGSAARALFGMLDGQKIQSRLVAIGPAVRQACAELGLSISLEAEEHSAAGIARAILQHCRG